MQKRLAKEQETIKFIQQQIAQTEAETTANRQKLDDAHQLRMSIESQSRDALRVLHDDSLHMRQLKYNLFEQNREFALQSLVDQCFRCVMDSYERREETGMWPGFQATGRRRKWMVSLTRDKQVQTAGTLPFTQHPVSPLLLRGLIEEVFERMDNNDWSSFEVLKQSAAQRGYSLTVELMCHSVKSTEAQLLQQMNEDISNAVP